MSKIVENADAPTPVQLALRPKDAAQALGIGTRLLWTLTNSGRIPCVRLGRCTAYPVKELEAWLARRAEGGKP